MVELQEMVEDNEVERKMLATRCIDLERKVEMLSMAVQSDNTLGGGADDVAAASASPSKEYHASLSQVIADADMEKHQLRQRITELESLLVNASQGRATSQSDLQRELANAEHGLNGWSQYAASIESENEMLREIVQHSEQIEAQLALQKDQTSPREGNPVHAGAGHLADIEREEGETILQELHSRSVAKLQAEARVNALAQQLADQLTAVTREKQSLQSKCTRLESEVEAANALLEKIDDVCHEAVRNVQHHFATQEHWRTASDLSVVLQGIAALVTARRRETMAEAGADMVRVWSHRYAQQHSILQHLPEQQGIEHDDCSANPGQFDECKESMTKLSSNAYNMPSTEDETILSNQLQMLEGQQSLPSAADKTILSNQLQMPEDIAHHNESMDSAVTNADRHSSTITSIEMSTETYESSSSYTLSRNQNRELIEDTEPKRRSTCSTELRQKTLANIHKLAVLQKEIEDHSHRTQN